MRTLWLTAAVACGVLTQLSAAQTPLAQAFQDLRSSDPAKVQKTKATLTIVLNDEWPIPISVFRAPRSWSRSCLYFPSTTR